MSEQQVDTVTDAADDWAAALAEQASTTATSTSDTDNLFAQASDAKPASGLFQPFAGSVASGTQIPIKHILQLAQGSVIELDGLAGEPMDVLVNGYLIAQGEVVVVNDKFGIRLTDIITPSERLRKLNR
jgi:flagellar motor switch protein FliN